MSEGQDSFLVPSTLQRFEIEIKRSRFVTTVVPVEGKEAARDAVQAIRDEFPDANHHCWAMVAGTPGDIYQTDQSDDGEPRGTAGKPMLNVLQHSGLGNTLVVVTRYFGGIKLGAGGLVRAYTQSVSGALASLRTQRSYIRSECVLELPYHLLDSLEHWLRDTPIVVQHKEFAELVQLTLQVPFSELPLLAEKIESLGKGMIRIEQGQAS